MRKSVNTIYDDVTDRHQKYLEAFFEEEFDKPENPVDSTQKRPMIPRQKIRAYIARMEEKAGMDRHHGCALSQTQSKAYSGYVHAASPQVMEMYGGDPPHFHVTGMRNTPWFIDHKDDLWNYFYRGLCAFSYAAKAFGDDKMFNKIFEYSTQFAKANDKEYIYTNS
ncbi:MAG: hypothetical protein D3903_19415 [Candidatus Electrothrix sp. GM3_4]|nr:hypothetical protein [Candidatus Electrothrix sp. GM3_4]